MGRREDDNMVKLRGLRIDLDDVANTLVNSADSVVIEAAVTLRTEHETQILVAHVVLRTGREKEMRTEDLQKMAHTLPLPAYMRPSLIIPVKSLPRTLSGKLDRGAVATWELPPVVKEGGEKLSLEMGELSLLWNEVLNHSLVTPRTNLTPESDFFMLGGSSLLLIQLQGAIRETLGLAVSITELYQASTLGAMAAHLRAKKGEQEPMEEIDWEKETEFPTPSLEPEKESIQTPTKSTREVLLTGAHTFLGAEILQALVRDNSVKRVHCVAIPRAASQLSERSSKIVTYPGYLQAESVGLSADDIEFLQPRLDLIIHAGSVGHCLNNYSSLCTPNVGSLRFLVGLALPRKVPVHFISSNRVTLLAGQHILPPVSVSQFQPPKDGSEGYTASKWACEGFLEAVAQKTGLSITIHRPCAITGPNAPSEDALNALLRFAISQNAVPRFRNLAGYLDFAPVAGVAARIAELAIQKPQVSNANESVVHLARVKNSPSLTIVHHSSGLKTPISGFRSRMEKLHGRHFDELDITQWIAEAVKGGMDPLISTYLEALVEKGQTIAFPYLGEPLRETR
jgi:thioester reductase-like protein/acyl carrier protein